MVGDPEMVLVVVWIWGKGLGYVPEPSVLEVDTCCGLCDVECDVAGDAALL